MMRRQADDSSATTAVAGPPLLILTSLAAGPKHGHALMLDIEEFAEARLGPGTLYGAITRLEQRGLIAPLPSGDRRQPYEITSAGIVALNESIENLRRVVEAGTLRLGLPAIAPTGGRPSLGGSPA